MRDRKNPYRALRAILAALPPERRFLLAGVLRGRLPTDQRETCGCAFGVAYPDTAALDRNFNTEDPLSIYQDMLLPPEETLYEGEAQAAGADFVAWVRALGGDERFLRNVVAANDDEALRDANDAETCARRYARVLDYLAEAADRYDREAAP